MHNADTLFIIWVLSTMTVILIFFLMNDVPWTVVPTFNGPERDGPVSGTIMMAGPESRTGSRMDTENGPKPT